MNELYHNRAWMMKIFQVKYKIVRGYNKLRKYVSGY